ncbi:ribosome-associated protein [Nocardioides zeae]|uniref:Ribosome-associated protein n=2 Tax=Nocardioides zeae TaxID=1457234 RepID=A0ACC6IMV1_9ACTN|nr:alternative ribosome rescue aminoacyl-tRNA hydrolase ArfB [Nocardioides zeae]MDQ1106445.1 ribosome-associated protein [Nocardioides zeae]MDR6173874.1 ribosome-associated protein [Nocardioides zeae]MDR6211837.1 ribosome-associated protein [Nocardioides zeae]
MDLSADLEVNARWRVPAGELVERFSRASGPGGQGVNTTDSRVELALDLARSPSLPDHLRERVLERLGGRLVDGTVVVVASEHRSQRDNRRAARVRLAALLRDAAAPPSAPRRATKPTRGSQRRRLAAKTRRSEVKRGRQGRWD